MRTVKRTKLKPGVLNELRAQFDRAVDRLQARHAGAARISLVRFTIMCLGTHLLAKELGGKRGEVAGARAYIEERVALMQLEGLQGDAVDTRCAQVLNAVAVWVVVKAAVLDRLIRLVDEEPCEPEAKP